jgi:beta-phosphoglucomutase-like phosphatase (HAD superfamily)
MPKFQRSIFDVDGVLADSPHEKAWRESLRRLMESSWRRIRDRTTWSPDAFTSHVYQQYVSGKPRMSGARAALDHFHVPDAETAPPSTHGSSKKWTASSMIWRCRDRRRIICRAADDTPEELVAAIIRRLDLADVAGGWLPLAQSAILLPVRGHPR